MTELLSERRFSCPYCAERVSIIVDTSAGSQSYIEDCQVCCQPIQFTIDVDGEQLSAIRVARVG